MMRQIWRSPTSRSRNRPAAASVRSKRYPQFAARIGCGGTVQRNRAIAKQQCQEFRTENGKDRQGVALCDQFVFEERPDLGGVPRHKSAEQPLLVAVPVVKRLVRRLRAPRNALHRRAAIALLFQKRIGRRFDLLLPPSFRIFPHFVLRLLTVSVTMITDNFNRNHNYVFGVSNAQD